MIEGMPPLRRTFEDACDEVKEKIRAWVAAHGSLRDDGYDGMMDPEVIELCNLLNSLPGIQTTTSCSGHGVEPLRIWFKAEPIDAIRFIANEFAENIRFTWRIEITTNPNFPDESPYFILVGPYSARIHAEHLAGHLRKKMERSRP